jgi:putative membrane protein
MIEDATRRTRLANERTWLAWLRTGIACLAAGLAVGRLVPELTGGRTWPYAILGTGYAALGIALIAYGQRRQSEVARAVATGGFANLSPRAVTTLTAVGVALGAGTVALVVLQA